MTPQHVQVVAQEDDVGALAGDVHGLRDGDADIGRMQGRRILEHPELVAERLARLARLVGRERVVGSTDCGFAQGPFGRRVHPTIMWAKLRALAEGAALASRAG